MWSFSRILILCLQLIGFKSISSRSNQPHPSPAIMTTSHFAITYGMTRLVHRRRQSPRNGLFEVLYETSTLIKRLKPVKLLEIRVRLMLVSVLVFWLMASRPIESVFSCLLCAVCSGLILSKDLWAEVLYVTSDFLAQIK